MLIPHIRSIYYVHQLSRAVEGDGPKIPQRLVYSLNSRCATDLSEPIMPTCVPAHRHQETPAQKRVWCCCLDPVCHTICIIVVLVFFSYYVLIIEKDLCKI